MKLLAVVDEKLKYVLEHNLGCEIEFYPSWDEVDASHFPGYGYVIAMGRLVENPDTPIALCGAASEIRFFGIPVVFVDVSFEAGNLIPRVYPQIKLLSYQGDPAQFIIQLKTTVPELFYENPSFRKSTSSAIANAWRHEEQSARANSLSHLEELSGPRTSSHDIENKAGSVSVRNFALSSIPLGMKSTSKLPDVNKHEFSDSSGSFRKSGMGDGRLTAGSSSGIELVLADVSSDISNVVNSDEVKEINEALRSPFDTPLSSGNNAAIHSSNPHSSNSQLIKLNENSQLINNEIILKRSTKDILLGTVEPGILCRVIQTLVRIGSTGVLEVVNESRSVKFEFRSGTVSSTSPETLLVGVLGWNSGSFNFNSSQMLSSNAQPVNIENLFSVAVNEILTLNTILRALETEFNNYIGLTNFFSMSTHFLNTNEQWWQKCNGSVKLSEVMMSCGVDMDIVSRDIYKAWLCDEICFMKEPITKTVKIEYEKLRIRASNRDQSSLSNLNLDNSSDSSHLNIIRAELQRVRSSFDTDDGYSILGVKPGCGTKALDDAYYAWINRYHSDRFVRFKDASFIRLANELVMLMNGTYAKLSKNECKGFGTARTLAAQQSAANNINETGYSSTRIGPGRARTNTLMDDNSHSKSKFGDAFDELNEKSRLSENKAQRDVIRPATISSSNNVDPAAIKNRQPSGQFVKMSDVLARRKASAQSLQVTAQDEVSVHNSSPSLPAQSWASSSVTPEQHFLTAKKKLTLGLAQEAVASLGWALEVEPDNPDYNIYHAYACFLVDPSRREEVMQRIQQYSDILHASYSKSQYLSPEDSERLFAPHYFIGKIAIAGEAYQAALEALQIAVKFNPSDVDTQRSLRYVTMQLEKLNDQKKSRASRLFSQFKDKFNIQ